MSVTEGNVLNSLNLSYFRLSVYFFLITYWWVKKDGDVVGCHSVRIHYSCHQKAVSQYVQNEGQARKCFRRATWLNHEISRYLTKIESRSHSAMIRIKG